MVLFQRSRKLVLQDLPVEHAVHRILDLGQPTNAIVGDATPDLDVAATMLYRKLGVFGLDLLPIANPYPFASVRAESVDLGLVRPHNTAPIVNCPMLMPLSKGQTLSTVGL